MKEALDNSQESLRKSYQLATISVKKNIYKDVLWACSMAEVDEYGTFQPKDVEKPLSELLGKQMKANQFGAHLINLCEKERGGILTSVGEKNRRRYKFKNPLMRPFLRLQLSQEKKATRH